MRRWGLGLVIPPLLASGCYARLTLATLVPAAGTTVRVTLTSDTSTRLTALVGSNAGAVDGRVLASSPDTLVLGVTQVLRRDDHADPWRGERLALPRRWVALVEGRRLSVTRTGLLVAGFLVAVIEIGRSFSTDVPDPNRCTVNC